jgi:hypothetical protein
MRSCLRFAGVRAHVRAVSTSPLAGARAAAAAAAVKPKEFRATLFPGDGIGPEISTAVQTIFAAARVPVEWEHHTISTHAVTPGGDLISQAACVARARRGASVAALNVRCMPSHLGASPPARAILPPPVGFAGWTA